MSISTRSGLRAAAIASPSSALPASMVSYPFTWSTSRTSFMFFSLSSTIRIRLIDSPRACGPRRCAVTPHRYRECERGALARLAFHPDAAAVQLDELLGQRQAESGAFLLLRVIAPDLAELLEHGLMIFGRDADPGVADRDLEPAGIAMRRYVDAAAVGRELDRVGQEVDEDLLHLALVGLNVAQRRIDAHLQSDIVPLRTLAHQRHRIGERRSDIECRQVELHPARLDLRQVEDVVDESQQVLARRIDVVQVIRLLLVHLAKEFLLQHLRKADDRVQRRAKLMRHVGEEL